MGRKNSIILPKTSLASAEAIYKQALFEEMRARQFAFCPYVSFLIRLMNGVKFQMGQNLQNEKKIVNHAQRI
jgi:hypothetical protein